MNPMAQLAAELNDDIKAFVEGRAGGATEKKVVELVGAITGKSDAAEARKTVNENPAIKTRLEQELSKLAEKMRSERGSHTQTDDISAARKLYYETISKQNNWERAVVPVLSLFITAGFITLVFVLIYTKTPAIQNNQVFNIALGAFATAFATVIGFHFGSSAGSKQKDGVNSLLLAEKAQAKPEAPGQ